MRQVAGLTRGFACTFVLLPIFQAATTNVPVWTSATFDHLTHFLNFDPSHCAPRMPRFSATFLSTKSQPAGDNQEADVLQPHLEKLDY